LRFVSNRCGGLLLVFEGRAYKLKHTPQTEKILCGCSKEDSQCTTCVHCYKILIKISCRGAMCINLEVTDAVSKKDHKINRKA
ncbi:hypothetical protein T11_4851, partial [Trichinella zimbabwensis]